ncbi:hypothetical protein BGZ60DRAFT_528070 [Tricladium varicosporioides]|nr:hypothetical protein BGZ60DRAFT_528070 [Hymenoscyphus varicosporioides]
MDFGVKVTMFDSEGEPATNLRSSLSSSSPGEQPLVVRSAGEGKTKVKPKPIEDEGVGRIDREGKEERLVGGKPRVKVRAPKVKTGCFTCRSRRVKCDEAKPACKRCTKFGVLCEGYPKAVKEPISTVTRKLIPRSQRPIPISQVAVDSFLRQPSTTSIREDPEFRYFQYYVNEVAAQIQGPFKTQVWDRFIPQAAELQPFVRNGIVAIAALSRSRKLVGWSKGPPLSDPEHQFALGQYCKALKGMRESITDSIEDGRNALIACLLVFVFESLQGHQAAASTHAANVVNLFFQLRWREIDNIAVNSSVPSKCADAIKIEKDLHDAFGGLDLQALLFLDKRSTSTHFRMKEEMNTAIDMQIALGNFETLQESRDCWQIIMRRNFHFVACARPAIRDIKTTSDTPPDGLAEDDTAIMVPENNAWNTPSSYSKHIPASLLTERNHYMEDINRWRKASQKVFSAASKQPSVTNIEQFGEYLQAKIMQINAFFNIVVLARAFWPPETAYDIYLSEFRATVDICTEIAPLLAGSGASNLFHFDIGIIPALSQTAMLCRDYHIRTRAIDILFSIPGYREGIWDSLAVASIDRWIRDIEVEFAEDGGIGFVPAERRAALSGVEIKLHERTCKVMAIQKCGPREEDVVERVGVLNW